MSLNNTPLSIVERKLFNNEGILVTKYFVWFGDECVTSTDKYEEAEEVYYNVMRRTEEPCRNVIKQAFISQPLNFNEDV